MNARRLILICCLHLIAYSQAHAQLRLPDVSLPQLPVVPETVEKTVGAVGSTIERTRLRDLRRLQVRNLIRRNPDVLERGPGGEPIVRRELLAYAPDEGALARARASGFEIAREENFSELDTRIVVLLAPPGTSTKQALHRLQQLDPLGSYDYNHIYSGSGALTAESTSPVDRNADVAAGTSIRVGLIDGGLLDTHPAFGATTLHSFGCDGRRVPSAHGTAVASLLIAAIPSETTLFSADVYCDRPTGGSVSALAAAFAWMARERVVVINVSLVGPPNRALERIVAAMLARGHVIVAAVGNDGPSAPPLYPAAYAGVIGVTGVDTHDRVLIEALRGPQVDFAAQGADVHAAVPSGAYGVVRGTSFASPTVAGLLAAHTGGSPLGGHASLLAELAKSARDLGKPGFDPVYGHGLLTPMANNQARRMD